MRSSPNAHSSLMSRYSSSLAHLRWTMTQIVREEGLHGFDEVSPVNGKSGDLRLLLSGEVDEVAGGAGVPGAVIGGVIGGVAGDRKERRVGKECRLRWWRRM